MISSLLSRLVILVFGTLYPAYASYKAVKSKNVKEYVKWMMYWIVFALFTCAETLTDLFFSFWFPFYYEIKILIVIWLLCPATKGSSIMYRNFVHPWLSCREEEIDEYIARAKEQSYATVLQLGTKGINYASTVIMQTALKGGGGIMSQLKRSYSLGDISDTNDAPERLISRGDSVDSGSVSARRPIKKSNAGSQANLYFPAMDVDVNSVHVPESDVLVSKQIQSVDDISSGYCSTDSVFPAESELQSNSPLTRTGSLGSSRIRTRALSGASKRTPSQEEILPNKMNFDWNICQSALQLSTIIDSDDLSTSNPGYATLPRSSSRRAPRKKIT
nr:PREDICTED: receptor expression-enhancing protein 2 isoform X2 [Bemisia tabaci]